METRAIKDDMIIAGIFDKNERSRKLESMNCQVLSIICITQLSNKNEPVIIELLSLLLFINYSVEHREYAQDSQYIQTL